jgi:photosystem II stability/assembly factor-like uncharacterized protein
MSSDGSKLAALASYDNIYLSADSGVTWSEKIVGGGAKQWKPIAMSSDGTKIAVVSYNIYISTDSGVTWSEKIVGEGEKRWRSIAMSPDGSKLVAACNNWPYEIYLSTDSGVTWSDKTI